MHWFAGLVVCFLNNIVLQFSAQFCVIRVHGAHIMFCVAFCLASCLLCFVFVIAETWVTFMQFKWSESVSPFGSSALTLMRLRCEHSLSFIELSTAALDG